MIDLDKAQHDAGWEPRFNVGGVVVRMAHPSEVVVHDERRGLVPWLARQCRWGWGLVAGASAVAELRKRVMECVEASDAQSRVAVARMSAWDVAALYGAYEAASQRVLKRRAEAGDADLNGASTGGEAAVPRAMAQPGGKSGHTLKVGERLPYFLGGARWGRMVGQPEVLRGSDIVNDQKETANG